ncbi:MAG: Rrf2 family transcriptional regulator [Bacteroidales bacterium]|nr:Rrf2 family transcriptional regulator [Bacteroidales bacterium]
MKLSKTADYSLRILSFMAKKPDELHTAKELVDKLNISDKYLRRLMTKLSKSGFIKSVQGREGGYRFTKPTEQIFVSQIIDAVDGLDKYMGCILGFGACSDDNPCALHKKWALVRTDIMNLFKTTSIAEMAQKDVQKI